MRPLKKSGLFLVLVGGICWLSFNLIGSTVDAQGILHEPFALIPIGFLFVVIGALLYAYAHLKR